jgi:hypothetical protein
MTVSAVVSPLTAEAFVIGSEPPPGLGAGCRTSPRGGAKDRPDPGLSVLDAAIAPARAETCEYLAICTVIPGNECICECLDSPPCRG